MSSFCPNGHHSDSADYCDTCGTPMGAGTTGGSVPGGGVAAPTPPVPSAPPAAGSGSPPPTAAMPAGSAAGGPGGPVVPATRPCPHCGATNEVDDLFCEACGYDFTTGTPPMEVRATRSSLDLGEEPDAPEPAPSGLDLAAAAEAPVLPSGAEAQPEPEPEPEPEPAAEPAAEPDPGPAAEPAPRQASAVPMPLAEPAPGAPPVAPPSPPAAEPPPVPMPAAAPPAGVAAERRRPLYRPPSQQSAPDWVVEIWIDPEWYAVQRSEHDCPSPDVPDVVPVRGRTALVGRPSATRNVHPDVDCGSDTGVSRRHAQFTSDGRRWWIEDLGSANGTYVGSAGAALPVDPIDVGRKVEVDAADRMYVGAWTRLVIRPATDSERAGNG